MTATLKRLGDPPCVNCGGADHTLMDCGWASRQERERGEWPVSTARGLARTAWMFAATCGVFLALAVATPIVLPVMLALEVRRVRREQHERAARGRTHG